MKTCQKCNSQNPDDAKYCWSCGQEFQQTGLKCPHCNQIILRDDEIKALKYCPFCGTNLAAQENTINGHEYVDLGLSVKWATCNIGASSPSDFGDYYAWGETTPKSEYIMDNSRTYDKFLQDISGNPEYDVARAKWGGLWRLPTKTEFEELKEKCTWRWISDGGHYGYRVQGHNGNSIFLPAAGLRYRLMDRECLEYVGANGYYWSSTMYDGCDSAYRLYFNISYWFVVWNYVYYRYPIRPVLE